MRIVLFGTASLLALAIPALAQAQSAAGAAANDPVLERLNALEARLKQLEARNAELEQQAAAATAAKPKTDGAKPVQFGWAPTTADSSGNFSFKPRGILEAEHVAFSERAGGYDYNNGTSLRRARLGFEGTAFKDFAYRIEADFAGNAVNVMDAYLQYTRIPNTVLTVGQHKAPFALESSNSDNYNVFLERGMFTNAFGNVGAERRIGVSVAYAAAPNLNLAFGVFGDNESVGRSSTAPVTNTPDESWGVNGRIAWEPVLEKGKVVHLGVSGFYRTALKSGDVQDAVRLSDRPNVRVDNGNIADSGVITGVESLYFAGAEFTGIYGPFTIASEYGRLWLDRPGQSNEAFDGFYVYATWFLTGESRSFKNGNFDRLKPNKILGKDGWGAFELALRYDKLDLANTPVLARAGNDAESITAALNWYLNPYTKLQWNWVRFNGTNSPLDPVGSKTKGDAFATRLHLDF